MTDQELATLFAALPQRRPETLEALWQTCSVPLYTVLLRIVRQRETAEDLLSELFVQLWQSPPAEVPKKPRAYLFQMARNRAVDTLRREKPTQALDELAAACVTEDDPALQLDAAAALMALPERERETVTLHLNAGFKFREIASLTGAPLGTVLWRYHSAIGSLRRMLSGGV